MDKLGQQKISRPQHDLLYASHFNFKWQGVYATQYLQQPRPHRYSPRENLLQESTENPNQNSETMAAQQLCHSHHTGSRMKPSYQILQQIKGTKPWKNQPRTLAVASKRSLSCAGSTFPSKSLSTKYINLSFSSAINTSSHFTN